MTLEQSAERLDVYAQEAWPNVSASWRKRLMLLMLQTLMFSDSHSLPRAERALCAALRVLAGKPASLAIPPDDE